jgi:hypothetical protein
MDQLTLRFKPGHHPQAWQRRLIEFIAPIDAPPICYSDRLRAKCALDFSSAQGWLHQAGFAIGAPVRVLVTPGRLVLEVDNEGELK